MRPMIVKQIRTSDGCDGSTRIGAIDSILRTLGSPRSSGQEGRLDHPLKTRRLTIVLRKADGCSPRRRAGEEGLTTAPAMAALSRGRIAATIVPAGVGRRAREEGAKPPGPGRRTKPRRPRAATSLRFRM